MSQILLISLICASMAFLGYATAEESEMDRKTEHEILVDLKAEEGFRSRPYRDSLNNLTIGYGHHLGGRLLSRTEHKLIFGNDYQYPLSIGDMADILHRNPMPEDVALCLLKSDVSIAFEDAVTIYGERYLSFPRDVKVAVLDMLFNLGFNKYLKFKKHIKAIFAGDYEKAAEEVVKSLAYTQAPHRYQKIHDRLMDVQPDPSPRVEVVRENEFKDDCHHWHYRD